jgi:hypothetical protein
MKIEFWPGGEPAARQILAMKSGAVNGVDRQERFPVYRFEMLRIIRGQAPSFPLRIVRDSRGWRGVKLGASPLFCGVWR